MFTIKFKDQDGFDCLSNGYDIRYKPDPAGDVIGWIDVDMDRGCSITWPTTVYVMNNSGATVGKYVICAPPKG